MDNMLENIIKNYNTPAYIFDIPKLKSRIQYLRSMLPETVKFCYAIKANPFEFESKVTVEP